MSYVIYLLSEVITTYLRYYSKYWEYLFSFVSVNIVINYLLGFKKKKLNYLRYSVLLGFYHGYEMDYEFDT